MEQLHDAIRPTTFIRPVKLTESLGIDITLASETFQHTGSFKFRAAYNTAFSRKEQHLIAASSGNFGQALAYACRLLGKQCHVVMPDRSAKVKIEAVRSYGATVDLIDVESIEREERVSQLMEKFPNAYRASAYDDDNVIAGNSTLGDEIGVFGKFDKVIVPVGGGGLISGISLGLTRAGYRGELVGAEPLLSNDAFRSLAAGKIIRNESESQSVADGARTISLGNRNWEIIRAGVSEIIEVSENQIKNATYKLFTQANLKAEPTGALSLGAILECRRDLKGMAVCCVVSGGNVDVGTFAAIITEMHRENDTR